MRQREYRCSECLELQKEEMESPYVCEGCEGISLEHIGVIIKADDGNVYQVALNKEMSETLINDLRDYFKGGRIKIIPTPIEGIIMELQ